MGDEVLLTIQDGIATVTMNRPDKRNAMNQAMVDRFETVFAELETIRDVRVVVVRGAGTVFSAGRDLAEMRAREGSDTDRGVADMFARVERSRHPTIAVIQGDAYAGGCELALHCDLRIVAEHARFAMPLARIGRVVPFTLGQKLIEIVGPAHAREFLLVGRPIDARRAYEIGMVHHVVPHADLEKATADMARTIAANAPLSLQGTKATIARALSLRERVEHADIDELTARARTSADAREGVRAMLEKRPPRFTGE